MAMREERGEKRGPCAVVGCKDPTSSSGQWNWLTPEEELAALEVELDPDAPTHLAPCACGRHTNLSKMGPRARGDTVDKVRSDYIVFGDFVCHSPYVYCMTAYWVPLSKLIKDVTRAKTVDEIEIFEGNLASLREDEMEGLSSADEESDKAVGCNITILP